MSGDVVNSPAADGKSKGHGLLSLKLLTISAAMFGFGYLMVPMYDIICEVTGLNGKTGRITVEESDQRMNQHSALTDREVIVEFVGIVSAGANWEFRPNQRQMKVRPGQQYDTSFFAKNLSSEHLVGQASPSVSPAAAARYFNKTECFCFTRQAFEANGSRDMPVTFVIDPKLPPNVDRVTLSYTFFKSTDQEMSESEQQDASDGKNKKSIWNQLGPSS